MSNTLIDQAVDAFMAALAGTEQVGDRITEDRSAAFDKDDAPAIDVRTTDADGQTMGDYSPVRSLVRVSLNVELAIYTRSAVSADGTEVPTRKLAGPIWKSAHGNLMADPTLCELTLAMQERSLGAPH